MVFRVAMVISADSATAAMRASSNDACSGRDRPPGFGPLSKTHPHSELTLVGLLYHLALVEESWVEHRFAGFAGREPWSGADSDAEPDCEFSHAADREPDRLIDRYRLACQRSRQVLEDVALEDLSA